MKNIKQEKLKLKDTLFKAPEPFQYKYKLVPSKFYSTKWKRVYPFRFQPMFWVLLVIETFWIALNFLFLVYNQVQFFGN